jgi:bifunctional DNA-binding transcriptional regulator/antitoxin component of YhaV-PrlF toxin-antitoxin module
MITTLMGGNQVTVPSELAQEMGLERGSRLDWKRGSEPGTMVIQVLPLSDAGAGRAEMLDKIQELCQPLAHRDLIRELIEDRVSER